jgi:hypothetical protein
MHQVEVDVQRLGGGFGGKEDQANSWACICAVATSDDWTGSNASAWRHADDKLSVFVHADRSRQSLKIIAYDFSIKCLERRPIFAAGSNARHIKNSIYQRMLRRAYSYRTNLRQTAFRGFSITGCSSSIAIAPLRKSLAFPLSQRAVFGGEPWQIAESDDHHLTRHDKYNYAQLRS